MAATRHGRSMSDELDALRYHLGWFRMIREARRSHPGGRAWIVRHPTEPVAVAAVLGSPLLKSSEVERYSRRLDLAPFALRLLAEDPRWARCPAVRRNLALNPHTPPEIARALLAELDDDELRRATACHRVTRPIAEHAAELLRVRRT